MDYVAGNLGENSFFKASEAHPIGIYAADFDGNQSVDAIPTAWFPDRTGQMIEYPYYQRIDIEKQLTKIKGLFPRHKEFGVASIQEVLAKFPNAKPLALKAANLRSAYIENLGGGKFKISQLPLETQTAPVYGALAGDFNGDGNPDLLLSGNDFGGEVGMGRYDAFNGLLLTGDGAGHFIPVPMAKSGICIPGDGKSLAAVKGADGSLLVAAGQNKGRLQVYQSAQNWQSIPLKPMDFIAIIHLKDGRILRQDARGGEAESAKMAGQREEGLDRFQLQRHIHQQRPRPRLCHQPDVAAVGGIARQRRQGGGPPAPAGKGGLPFGRTVFGQTVFGGGGSRDVEGRGHRIM